MDNLISIDHAKPYTSSQLTYKGILHGKSRAVFGGQVLVRKDAQKVKAQQSDKNLLLSRQAEVDSKPSLLIYADDVQCSHGATAGHLEEDSLFYLRSRGLDLDTANRMLVQAFAREIIETVKLEPLVEYLDQVFTDAIPTTGLQLGGRR
jgi:Fe-S cluster assembly protein SufD